MTEMITLKRPALGSVGAVIAPSSPGWRLSKQAEHRATEVIAQLGLVARPSRHLRSRAGHLAVDSSLRLIDLQEALEDPEVGAIFTVFGGYNSIDLIDHLPYELWAKARKPLIGFSDITALSAALWSKARLPSFHGPNFATLGSPAPHRFTFDSLHAALRAATVQLTDPETLAEDLWFRTPKRQSRDWSKNSWRTMQGGRCSGRLLGGNLPTLLALAGTPYFPILRDSILLIECDTSNAPTLIDRGLAQLGLMGAFDEVVGIVLGSFGKKTDAVLPELIAKHLRHFHGPILGQVNCSHVDPTATLPYGGVVTLDADEKTLSYAPPFHPD